MDEIVRRTRFSAFFAVLRPTVTYYREMSVRCQSSFRTKTDVFVWRTLSNSATHRDEPRSGLGFKIMLVGAKVQDNVKQTFQNMTGITVSRVDVIVAGLEEPAADQHK